MSATLRRDLAASVALPDAVVRLIQEARAMCDYLDGLRHGTNKLRRAADRLSAAADAVEAIALGGADA